MSPFLLDKSFRDPRYSHLIGRTVFHPFRGEEIPIIADEYVDQDFGTGAVKVRYFFLWFLFAMLIIVGNEHG